MPLLVVAYGWRAAFVITGVVTFVWLVAWLAMYRRPREHKRVSAAELAYIEQDPVDPAKPMPWRRLATRRETWAYALGKFCIDPIWWFFLFWLPGFLGDQLRPQPPDNSGRRWSPSTCSPTSARSPAAGRRRG